MQEGKTRQYFLYAIGEIVLVVIGILIALQINNTFKELLNSGNLALITNESIKNALLDIESLHIKTKSLQLIELIDEEIAD